MGNQGTHLNYSIECSEKKEGETSIRRSPGNENGLKMSCDEQTVTLQDSWLNAVKLHADLMCIFQRNPTTRVYEGKTYKEIHELAQAIGSGIIEEKLTSEGNEDPRFPSMKMIGVFSKNCLEWVTLDIANILYGNTMIPLYDSLGAENITYCLNHSGITTCFANESSVTQLAKTKDIGKLKNIVVLGDPVNPDAEKILSDKGIKFYTWNQLEEIGKKNIRDIVQVNKNDCVTFSYTSGTTGDPKAAMMSHSNFVSVLAVLKFHPDITVNPQDVHLSYLPLPHVYERLFIYAILSQGAKVYMYSGDVMKLKDDLADVKPTFFSSVPRLYNRFYDLIRKQFDKATGLQKYIIETAMKSKMDKLKQGKYTHAVYDKLVFKKTKAIFGGNVRFLVTSSAPISKDVIDFMKVISCSPVVEAYGQTESTGASFTTFFADPETGHTGGPTAALEYKLVDVPEMNYFSTDVNEKGEPQPRGEICMRGPGVFLGYYKDAEKTKEAITSDGWLLTGDVGMILPHNKALKIIDRKKNIFKLQQGEYIAPEKIENCYLKVRGVAEVFVHGDSLESYTVAIVVPEKEYILNLGKTSNINETFEELCKNSEIKKQVLADLEKQGRGDKLFGFELAKKIYLCPESMANFGCMTNTMKLQRHNARKYFKPQIDEMYSTPLEVQEKAQK